MRDEVCDTPSVPLTPEEMLKLTYVRATLLSFPRGTRTPPEGPRKIPSLFLISVHMVSIRHMITTHNRVASSMKFSLSPSTSMFIGFTDPPAELLCETDTAGIGIPFLAHSKTTGQRD